MISFVTALCIVFLLIIMHCFVSGYARTDGNWRFYLPKIDGGLQTSNGTTPKGFTITGADQKFAWADAIIEDYKIILWNDSVTSQVAVRYAWADNPERNLTTEYHLPAIPFWTDQLPGLAADRK